MTHISEFDYEAFKAERQEAARAGSGFPFELKTHGEVKPSESGVMRDTAEGKLNWTLAFDGPMLRRWAAHLTKGVLARGKRNWMNASTEEDRERFRESAARHFMQWYHGETDEDHAAAVFFNINGAEYVEGRNGEAKNDMPKVRRTPDTLRPLGDLSPMRAGVSRTSDYPLPFFFYKSVAPEVGAEGEGNPTSSRPGRRKRVAVDWDGTCVEGIWPARGDWLPGAVKALAELQEQYEVWIYTTRIVSVAYDDWNKRLQPDAVESEISYIRGMLNRAGLRNVRIFESYPGRIPGKISADLYVDDKAVRFRGHWPSALREIEVRLGG